MTRWNGNINTLKKCKLKLAELRYARHWVNYNIWSGAQWGLCYNHLKYSNMILHKVRQIQETTMGLLQCIEYPSKTHFNSLAPGRFHFYIRKVIFKLTLVNGGWGISYEIALRWIPQDLTDDKSTLVPVMAWCRQATSHYLSQCWPRSMSPNGVTRPEWVKLLDFMKSCLTSWVQPPILTISSNLAIVAKLGDPKCL